MLRGKVSGEPAKETNTPPSNGGLVGGDYGGGVYGGNYSGGNYEAGSGTAGNAENDRTFGGRY